MKLSYLKTGIPLTALLLLSGCVDDNYDLSDVDSTSTVKVNDLTLPLRIKPITLENVLDINESDPDAAIIVDRSDPNNPVYAVRKSGDFTAQAETIDKVSAESSDIESTYQISNGEIVDYAMTDASAGRHAPGNVKALKFQIDRQLTGFDYDVTDVDKAIFTISAISVENSSEHTTVLGVRLGSEDIASRAERVIFENVSFILPEGTSIVVPAGCTYKNNVLTIPRLVADASNGFTPYYEVVLTGMSFDTPIRLKSDNDLNGKGSCHIAEEIGIEVADLYVIPESETALATLPTTLNIRVDYRISDLLVDGFSGRIRYDIDMDKIPSVDLSDIPDFLAGEETDVTLFEPQLTLNVNNPVGDYNIGAYSGVTLTPYRKGQPSDAVSLDEFRIGNTGNGPWNIKIGPRVEDATDGYSLSYNFPELSKVLSGKGLPSSIDIELKSSKWSSPVIMGDARDFPLGRPIDQIKGEYVFYSPFALCDGSTIVYTYEDKDWDDEDLQKVQASLVKVTATVTTDLPCSVEMTCALLDKWGNTQPMEQNEYSVAKVGPNAPNQEIELRLVPLYPERPFHDVDGIVFTAKAVQEDNGAPLRPDQIITLENVRFTVTGTYTTDF